MLRIKNLVAGYGRASVLRDVSVDVEVGGLTTVLGPNGAGKSTLMRSISGVVKASHGSIEFQGERLDRLEAHEIVRRGVVHVPEGRQIFPDLTVAEHLQLGAIAAGRPSSRPDVEEFIFNMFPRLKERRRQTAGTLSGGARGLTVLLVEQNTRLAMALSNIVYVLENGAIAFSGTRDEAKSSSVIQDLYLGVKSKG